MQKKRVVIAGFGDTGLLVAIHLGAGFDVIGISPKPCLVSGQELGLRLTQPQAWKRDYLMPFRRYRKLDEVNIQQGRVTAIDTERACVDVRLCDGSLQSQAYDALVIASGVSNGFWRDDAFEDIDALHRRIDNDAQQLLQARTIAIVGGGATGVSVAANLAARHPDKSVHLFCSQSQVLPGYHPKARDSVERHLRRVGVHLHHDHRAVIPPGFRCDRFSFDAVQWTDGRTAFHADITLWAVGGSKPNNEFIPAAMLDARGFVKTDATLRVTGYDNVFAVGDIAATDPHRSSARNWGYRLLGHNIRACLEGRPERMKHYTSPAYRWGSIFGVQDDGLRVFQPEGGSFRFPRWSVHSLLFPLAVRRMIYKGVRK